MARLDAIVSEVIRRVAANYMGFVDCITCGHVFHWKDVDCGHFQKRGNMATRYDRRNLGPQCKTCNRYKDGEEEVYGRVIDIMYGPGTAAELEAKANTIEHDFPFEEQIVIWQSELDLLRQLQDNEIQY